MSKHDLQNDYNQIPVPQAALQERIRQGMEQGKREQQIKRPKRLRRLVVSTGLAASLLITSTFVIPSFATAMAKVPLLGQMYRPFLEQENTGTAISQKQLATKIDQVASDNGIDIQVIDAYYDGVTIGMNLTATGVPDVKAEARSGLYELFKGDKRFEGTETMELVQFKQVKGVWQGRIEYMFGETKLKDTIQIPVVLTDVFGVKGNWSFNVPVKRLPAVEQVYGTTVKNSIYQTEVTLDKLIQGKGSTSFDYTTRSPEKEWARVEMTLLDSSGKEIIHNWTKSTQSVKRTKSGTAAIEQSRLILGNYVIPKGSYLLQPSLSIDINTQPIPLTEPLPYRQQSETHPLEMTITSIETTPEHVVIEFSRNSRSLQVYVKPEIRDSMYLLKGTEPPDGREIKPKVTVLDAGKQTFRATFRLPEPSEHTREEYYLETGYSNTVINTPLELQPIPFTVN
ncbi:DUF4179 domain-containing protein [Exiguobacterium sp. RIT452]|uniref:DUF4179 domain-containing protein n=1 Tax=Exiguobacterium sp. RIT452 TaxID=2315552 RepID=UPI000E753D8B|nr:DUF4179 domain-containing protein [Exiguobacterium sp. RIT452]RJO96901.1 DUF4179 domain-containing protein [Exiguobacterium sp. RIT452]